MPHCNGRERKIMLNMWEHLIQGYPVPTSAGMKRETEYIHRICYVLRYLTGQESDSQMCYASQPVLFTKAET